MAGGFVMIWAVIGMNGKTDIIALLSKVNGKIYLDPLQRHLLPKALLIASCNFIFQRDKAAVYIANTVKASFAKKKNYIS